jgi:hypothetical protein
MTSGRCLLHLAMLAALLPLWVAGCNRRTSVLDANLPSISPSPNPPARPESTLMAIELQPPGMMGGSGGRGTAFLRYPAPEGGITITMSSTDASVSVTPSIHVAEGTVAAEFAFTTQPVAADRQVLIAGSASGRSIDRTLSVWAVLPAFFSFNGDRGERVSRGQIRRFTPANATMLAACQESKVRIQISTPTEFWHLDFGAPPGLPLRVGTYENARRGNLPSTGSLMDVSGNSTGCTTSIGTFVVHEVDLTFDGRVRKFWATFEQRCEPSTGAMRGDVRILDGPFPISFTRCILP